MGRMVSSLRARDFRNARNTKPYFEKIGVACPKCGKEVVLKKTEKGRLYYGCEDNPECDFMSWQKPAGPEVSRRAAATWWKKEISWCVASETCGYVEARHEG